MSLKSRIKSLFANASTGAVLSEKSNQSSASESEVRGTITRFEFKQDIETLSFIKTIARGNSPRVLLLTSEKGAYLERLCRRTLTKYKPAFGFFVIQPHKTFSGGNFLRLTLNGAESPTLTFDISNQHQTLVELLHFLEIDMVHVFYTQGGKYQFLSLLKDLHLPFNLEVRESVIEQLAEDSEAMNDYKWLSNNCKQLSDEDSK